MVIAYRCREMVLLVHGFPNHIAALRVCNMWGGNMQIIIALSLGYTTGYAVTKPCLGGYSDKGSPSIVPVVVEKTQLCSFHLL